MQWLRSASGLLLCCVLSWSAEATGFTRQLEEVARVASVMVDGDVCERIMTSRATALLLKEDPRDKWAASDNFDVNDEPYIRIKKTLIRLSRLGPPRTDVNLWMPVPGNEPRVQILIRNVNEISQFWKWGDLHQPAPLEMLQVLKTGKPVTVSQKQGFVSVLAPVSNSLGDVIGLVEVVAQRNFDPRENVK